MDVENYGLRGVEANLITNERIENQSTVYSMRLMRQEVREHEETNK